MKNHYCTWRACTASIHWVRSNSEDKKNVYVRAAERFPTRKTKLGDASTSCASRSASFFRCLSEPRIPSFERYEIDQEKNKIWHFIVTAFGVHAENLKWDMLEVHNFVLKYRQKIHFTHIFTNNHGHSSYKINNLHTQIHMYNINPLLPVLAVDSHHQTATPIIKT